MHAQAQIEENTAPEPGELSETPLSLVEESSWPEYLKSLGQEDDRFYPDTAAKIDWVFQKVAEAEAHAQAALASAQGAAAAYRNLANEIEARGQAKADDILRTVRPLIAMFREAIEKTGAALVAEQPKSQTLKLTFGEVAVKKNSERYRFPKLKAEYERAAVAWAQENVPEAVVQKPELSRATLKDLLVVDIQEEVVASTGDIQEFVTVALPDGMKLPEGLIEIKPAVDITITTLTKWDKKAAEASVADALALNETEAQP